jgi:hypothetical protein
LTEFDQDTKLVGELIEIGSEFGGAAAGSALTLIGGSTGMIAGAAGVAVVAQALKHVGAQLRQRLLDPRQEVRVGGAFTLAAAEIASRVEAGEHLRDDGFFDATADGHRVPGEEILEGILKAAADAHEERKIPYLAHLYASLALREDISVPYANTLIQLAERCTWRQLIILGFVDGRWPDSAEKVKLIVEDDTEPTNEPTDAIWSDCDALGYAGLIGVPQQDASVAHIAAVLGGGSFRLMERFRIGLMPPGELLVDLMRLREIPRDDFREVIATLLRTGRPGLIPDPAPSLD